MIRGISQEAVRRRISRSPERHPAPAAAVISDVGVLDEHVERFAEQDRMAQVVEAVVFLERLHDLVREWLRAVGDVADAARSCPAG